MEEVDIPQFFICPISLQMMTDPVTLSSGITFDRQSIEKWLFSGKGTTCPVTKVPVSDTDDLTPNHTLRRLIQSWCTLNAHHGIDRIPTPKPPVTKSDVSKLLAAPGGSTSSIHSLIRQLKSIASQNESNKRVIEAAGGVNFLASTIIKYDYNKSSSSDIVINDAMFLLHTLQLSESGLKTLLLTENGNFIDALSKVMEKGSYESRVYAVFLLRSMFEIADPVLLSGLNPSLFFQLTQLLKDQISRKASKACLQVLTHALRWGRNKVKAAESGAVTALVELLMETTSDKRMCELMLTAMNMVCRCAEGRAKLVGHAAGLAVVSKKILRVSVTASDRAVRILNSISRYSATPAVLQEMLQVGAVAKLCYVVELELWGIESGIKEKAAEVIKLHARTWRASPCVPHTHLLFS